MALLDVTDLTVAFAHAAVVRGISFHIDPGETLALVGESGCGKSMTAFALLQLLPRQARISGGQIRFAGQDLVGASPRALRDIRGRRIGLILQEPMTSLNPVLPVGAQVAEMIRCHESISRAAARKRVIELFDLVGIPDPAKRCDAYPHTFSGGMRQRVMIAMAIACGPDLLVADEPTTALDVTIQAQVLDLLADLRRQMGMAMLLITHDLGVVAQWADRVAVMYAGRIVEQAPVGAFLEAPLHPYAQGLMQSDIDHDEAWHYSTHRLQEIPGSVASARGESGCAFAPRCDRTMPLCRTAPPPLHPSGEGRSVACVAVP